MTRKYQTERVCVSGCPYCAGKKVTNENSFAVLHPEKANEWNYEKNMSLLPK